MKNDVALGHVREKRGEKVLIERQCVLIACLGTDEIVFFGGTPLSWDCLRPDRPAKVQQNKRIFTLTLLLHSFTVVYTCFAGFFAYIHRENIVIKIIISVVRE